MRYEEFTIEGRNAVIEAYRAGRPIDKLFILDGCQDGPILTIKREAKAKQTPVKFVTKERLDQLSETGNLIVFTLILPIKPIMENQLHLDTVPNVKN